MIDNDNNMYSKIEFIVSGKGCGGIFLWRYIFPLTLRRYDPLSDKISVYETDRCKLCRRVDNQRQ